MSRRRPFFALLFLLLALSAVSALPASADGDCRYVAAPGGSDSAPGSYARPFRTAQKVVDSLHAGEVGCLRRGTYSTEVNGPFVVNFERGHGGAAGAPIVLRSFPGERAKLRGVVVVSKGADHVTISGFDIDGRRARGHDTPIGIQLMAQDTVLENNNITDPTANCLTLGVDGWGTAVDNVIRGNVFRNCGTPAAGLHDHAIYVNDARGGQIVDNVFLRSAAWAVHFYGRAVGVRVAHNVMSGNGGGVIFAGYGSHRSSGNVVEQNVIVGSRQRPAVSAYWDGLPGSGNVARNNCVYDNYGRDIDLSVTGFSALGNVTADPEFSSGLRLGAASACRSVVGYDTAAQIARRH